MSDGTDKPHISASQLGMYARCPEQYRRRYMEGERRPPGIALLVGSGFHVGAEMNFTQKIETHEDLPASEIVDAAVAGFELRLAGDGLLLSGDEAGRGQEAVVGEAKDQTAQLAYAHAKLQAPDYQPVVVEHKTRIVFPNATHDLLAITDLRDDQSRVVDLKTAARKQPAGTADKSMQLTVYAGAFQVDTGAPPTGLRLDTITKTKTPARQIQETTRTAADFQALVNRVNAVLAAIAAGNFPPCDPSGWNCSPKWCGYWADCPYTNSESKG